MQENSQKAVFLDRDGVINVPTGYYVYRPADFILHEGVLAALTALDQAGFLLIVVTNQGGIDKGLYTHEQVAQTHAYMQTLLGGLLHDIWYSPYHDAVTRSLSRKPSGYMLSRAAALHGISLARSWMVGDSPRDIAAGIEVGVRTVLIAPTAGGLGEHAHSVSLQQACLDGIGPFAPHA